MPPPPPPSASYSLIIEDSSSEEEEDEEEVVDYDRYSGEAAHRYHREFHGGATADAARASAAATDDAAPLPPRSNGGPPPPPQDAMMKEGDDNRRSGGWGAEEEEGEEGIGSPPAKKKKKNKGKKRKKKKKKKKQTKDGKREKTSSGEEDGGDAPDDDDDDENDEVEEGEDFDPNDGAGTASHSSASAAPFPAMRTAPDAEAFAASDVPDEFDLVAEAMCDRLAATAVTASTKTSPKDGAVAVAEDEAGTTRVPPSFDVAAAADDDGRRRKSRSSRSISFGAVSVREYARALGTHVVPADGGWPLGLSDVVIAEHRGANVDEGGMDHVVVVYGGGEGGGGDDGSGGSPPSSPPRRRIRLRSRSDSLAADGGSPGRRHCHRPTSWTIDDFESRRQIELRRRYAQLVRDFRRRKFEKEWEKRNLGAVVHGSRQGGHPNGNNIRKGRSRSGSFGGSSGGGGGGGNASSGGGGGRSRAASCGSFKVEMTAEDREELDVLLNRPVALPGGDLETRPHDYKRRVCHGPKSKSGPGGKNGHGVAGNVDWQGDAPQPQYTEEDELYNEYGGRNPLFRPMREDDRRKALLRDDHLMKKYRYCQLIVDDANADASSSRTTQRTDAPPSFLLANDDDDDDAPLDPADGAVSQRVQHDLEALRIRRSDLSNLGCSCRKLHVFLPGSTDRSHHKKKSSHRRLPDRKVREELRKRGLLHGGGGGGGGDEGGASLSREDVEVMLHDAIEKEPCCWGNDCPCWRDGIGCQADTCSCWHASRDVGAGASNAASASKQDAAVLSSRCGNPHGIYIVDFDAIALYRGQHVTTCIPTPAGE